MKKISIITILSGLLLTGCLKDDPNVDFSHPSTVVQFINAGLGYFSSDALLFKSDTLTVPITVNLASVNPLNKDITVSISVDDAAFNTYNGTSTTKYVKMADSSYSLPKKTVTIPAGKRIDTLYISFYKHTFDPSKSYLLPISITDASGITIASNFQTHYFHVIGNPIAGTYEQYWSRWNAADSLGGAASPNLVAYKEDEGTVTFSPIDPTSIEVTSLVTGDVDSLYFTNNNGVFSDFGVKVLPISGVTSNTSGVLEAADPATGYYRISFGYVNASGASRVVVNEYIKQ